VLAARGYPGEVETGQVITGLDRVARECPDALVFHAGVRERDGQLVTAGGRVLTVVGRGGTYEDAIDVALRRVSRVHFDGMQYRRTSAARRWLGDPSAGVPGCSGAQGARLLLCR
jgi:phosphoribosylamine---glycine ligase